MRRNFWIGLGLIAVVVGLAGYVSWPTTETLSKRSVTVRQGLDLQGGVRLVYELDLSKTVDADKPQAAESTREVIEKRVNSTGVTEPTIQAGRIGPKQVAIVELPGIKDVNEAIELIGKTAQLEFREAGSQEDHPENQPWLPTGLTGKQLKRARVDFDPTTNAPRVSLEFNDEGKKLFGEITSRNVSKPVAIFLDEEVISSPTVQQAITTGEAVITGEFTIQEIKQLVSLLNAGALEVPIKLVEQRTVGATLGEESVKRSLIAGLVGLILVAVFMTINYRLAGLIAILALICYALITFALFKLIPITLTLSGMAGFILSIGMAVDANILIFERLREELRDGKDLGLALEEGFRRAWPSVRDSNIATLLTCAVLYFATTGSIRGFAVTLALGVLVSLFSSITISRALLRLTRFSQPAMRLLARI